MSTPVVPPHRGVSPCLVLLTLCFSCCWSTVSSQRPLEPKKYLRWLLIKLAKARGMPIDEAIASALTAGRKYINSIDGFGEDWTPIAL